MCDGLWHTLTMSITWLAFDSGMLGPAWGRVSTTITDGGLFSDRNRRWPSGWNATARTSPPPGKKLRTSMVTDGTSTSTSATLKVAIVGDRLEVMYQSVFAPWPGSCGASENAPWRCCASSMKKGFEV